MRPADPEVVRRALAAVAAWPVETGPVEVGPAGVPLADLDNDALVERVGRRLPGAPRRAAQSALVMGLASRLWSATVVPFTTHGVVADPAALRVRDDDGAIVLGLASARGLTDLTPDDLHALVLEVLSPVVAASRLAARLQWGNVAASMHAVPRVHHLPAARLLVADLLVRAPYAGELDELPDGRARRRTCCLFYLVPGAGLCGDCVHDRVPLVGSA